MSVEELSPQDWGRILGALDGIASVGAAGEAVADALDLSEQRGYQLVEEALDEGVLEERDTGAVCDEVVAATPVEHTHDNHGVNSFSLLAYSLTEIFAEKLRTIYQRSRGRDYRDLYQIVIGDETPPETVAAIFEEKRSHAPMESYHTSLDPGQGLPVAARERIADDWETTIPELVVDPPALETVQKRLDAYLFETLAPALDE